LLEQKRLRRHDENCPCHGTGYVTRTVWQELADSGIEGGLWGVLELAAEDVSETFHDAYLEAFDNYRRAGYLHDLASISAVKEAMVK